MSGEKHDPRTPEESELRVFETVFLRAHRSLPPPDSCPIGWQPSALAPVFYGVRDLDRLDGAPVPLRVFFPSLDGSVFDAPILKGCGRYPVIVLAHGHCRDAEAEHYKRWFDLPAQLARSGYVVVVPELPAISAFPSEDHPALETLADVLRWIRRQWEHRDVLLPAPATGIVGHSYGALLSARVVGRNRVVAFASLSGRHSESLSPILAVTVPMLFIWGGPDDLLGGTALSDEVWNALTLPKHRAEFAAGMHWDYLGAGRRTPCGPFDTPGPCRNLSFAAADLVTMFFAKYLPPELSPDLPFRVPDSLLPPPLVLSPEQQFFAAGHLTGIKLIGGKPGCEFSLDWDTPGRAIEAATGVVSMLRVHELGTGFGPDDDHLNAEVIIQLSGRPGESFGFQLRDDPRLPAARGMLATLRAVLALGSPVTLEFVPTGPTVRRIIRVVSA